jgi:hypothetical protein
LLIIKYLQNGEINFADNVSVISQRTLKFENIMQVFNTIDSSSFRYNGLKYAKNFMIIPQGVTGLGIYNAFDTSLQLIASAKFSDVQIDGIV